MTKAVTGRQPSNPNEPKPQSVAPNEQAPMSNQCDDALHDVYSYLDRELSKLAAWRVRRHLRGCGGCEAAYGFEERLRVVIRLRLQEETPPEFLARLRAAIDHERGRP